jgi:poly-gamma-glutamate capsule biosynthesis protein CapA/YwtB (metallophosphatase superfamily)
MGKELRISFLGDICAVNRVGEAILNDDFSNFEDVSKILQKQDLVIANLECPLTLSGNKISKIGPNLKGHPKTINLLKHLNINVAALANNHILDYDAEGLSDTLKLLKESDIEYVGAGLSPQEAAKPFTKQINGINICILNVCEREFNISETNGAGANLFDIISVLGDIKKYRDSSDLMILFYHGGVETYNLPTPDMYRNFRFLAEQGIDIIVCNHQHTFSGYEQISKSYIFYGLGNFIFDSNSKRNQSWNYGIFLNFTIQDGQDTTFEIVPYEQCKNSAGVKIDTSIKEKALKELDILNSKLTKEVIEKEWQKYALKENSNILAHLCIQNRYIRYLFKKTGLINLLITKEHERRLYGYFICQSHSELMRESLKN